MDTLWWIIGGLIVLGIVGWLFMCSSLRPRCSCQQFGSDETSKVAVIIEPRQHKALAYSVNSVAEVLGPEWHIQVFHGTKNQRYVITELSSLIRQGRVSLVNIGQENFTALDYNLYTESPRFWNQVKGEHVLIFQTDSMLLKGSPYKIDEFLTYAYVGAPWKWHQGRVGCGGLSLRRKSAALCVLKHQPHPNPTDPDRGEDVYYSDVFRGSKLPTHQLAPANIAQKFCVGSMYHPHPFSVHQCWGHIGLTPKELQTLTTAHPEIQRLIDLQKKD